MLRPAWDFAKRLWACRTPGQGAAVVCVAGRAHRPAPVPGITGEDVRRFLVSRDGSRLVAVVRGPVPTASVSRLRYDADGGVTGASRARADPVDRTRHEPHPGHRVDLADHDRRPRPALARPRGGAHPERRRLDRPGRSRRSRSPATSGTSPRRPRSRRRTPCSKPPRSSTSRRPSPAVRSPIADSTTSPTRGDPQAAPDRVAARPAGWSAAAVLDASRDLLLGSTCVGCGRPGRLLCAACAAALEPHPAPAWPTPRPPGLTAPWAATSYDGTVRAMVLGHKEHRLLGLARPLGELLALAVAMALDDLVAAASSADLAARAGAVAAGLGPATRSRPDHQPGAGRGRPADDVGHARPPASRCSGPARVWPTRRGSTRCARAAQPGRCLPRPRAGPAPTRPRRTAPARRGVRRRAHDRSDRRRGPAGAPRRRSPPLAVVAVAATRRRTPLTPVDR